MPLICTHITTSLPYCNFWLLVAHPKRWSSPTALLVAGCSPLSETPHKVTAKISPLYLSSIRRPPGFSSDNRQHGECVCYCRWLKSSTLCCSHASFPPLVRSRVPARCFGRNSEAQIADSRYLLVQPFTKLVKNDAYFR